MPKRIKKLTNILGEGDMQAMADVMGGLLDKQAAILASKKDLEKLATKQDVADLKDYMDQGFESVMAGIDAVAEKLTEKEKFDRLVDWAREVGNKVGVKVKI